MVQFCGVNWDMSFFSQSSLHRGRLSRFPVAVASRVYRNAIKSSRAGHEWSQINSGHTIACYKQFLLLFASTPYIFAERTL